MEATQVNGPRVTPADVEAEIVSQFFFTAADGVLGESQIGTAPAAWVGLERVTFAVLTLRNGTKVVGINYGAIDPAQHSSERGRDEARKDAVNKVYELLGFRLRDELARPVLTEADALADLNGTPRPSRAS
ncbi:TPA: hypothetical protein NHP85_001512 [Pseudomonas aeruginosa]|nr:hypothetical protein [Pseudomonas aeruginosa]